MISAKFKLIRKKLRKKQRQMAQLLGVSESAVHAYEQGRRAIPPAVERQLYFLVMLSNRSDPPLPPCWEIRNCPVNHRAQCPAWQFNRGDLCWFINGTLCNGSDQGSWQAKMSTCCKCPVFAARVVI